MTIHTWYSNISENACFGSRILFDMPNQSDVEVSNQILELYGVGLERHYTYTSSFPEVISHFSTVGRFNCIFKVNRGNNSKRSSSIVRS